jgi:small neutral amino acid transporter SnatA (MarC family)
LLVILDPFMAIPILLALTEDCSKAERNRVARIAALTVAAVLVVVGLAAETPYSTGWEPAWARSGSMAVSFCCAW